MSAGKQGGAKLTPMLTQYLDIKRLHPDALLLFRMGDFYETFFEDAEILARVAGVTLTSRDRKSDNPVPLAGVPHHALDTYLSRLLESGLTVAICDQVEDPAKAKGLVKREVTQVISPGTATSPELVAGAAGHYCLAVAPGQDRECGWSLIDASTGEFRCGQEETSLEALCERHPVREAILPESVPDERLSVWRAALPSVVINRVNPSWFHPSFARSTLCEHFGVLDLDAFGLADDADRSLATAAAGAALRYLLSLNLSRPDQVTGLAFCAREDRLLLDEETLRNLEVFRTFRGERGEGTLVHHIDATVTPQGRRLLERRLAEPLTDLEELGLWHRGVDGAVRDRGWRGATRETLAGIGDLERWSARAASGRLGPAQARRLGGSLLKVEELRRIVAAQERAAHPAAGWADSMPALEDLGRRLLDTLAEDAPALAKAGGVVRSGFDPELDDCRSIASDTRGFLASLQSAERERTGIGSLKVGFNKVFGYYFEVTNKHLDKVPEDYVQKQTLVNAARFHTPELKQAEQKILAAEDRARRLEAAIFADLLKAVAGRLSDIAAVAAAVAAMDLMFAFAELAEKRGYCRPVCDQSLLLDIREGRHPVVECLLDSDFIPNDTRLDCDNRQVLLLTGPNMGGKSTYLRQVALIVLMAQAGGFVPAAEARIGIADRIFTRVGASDNVARGQSTFFAEMSESARILHQMTRRSLVILDEIGRGTSTYDGLSLAWAITEFVHAEAGPRPRTIFATHYHELTDLEQDLPRLVNMRMGVKEWEGRIIFLHSVEAGRSDKSYGIHVARLAGIPEPVLRRAEALLAALVIDDAQARDRGARAPEGGYSLAADAAPDAGQLSLFTEGERDALEALRGLDLDRISPVDAFMWLVRIRRQLDGR